MNSNPKMCACPYSLLYLLNAYSVSQGHIYTGVQRRSQPGISLAPQQQPFFSVICGHLVPSCVLSLAFQKNSSKADFLPAGVQEAFA